MNNTENKQRGISGNTFNQKQRFSAIMSMLSQNESLTVGYIAQRLNVSEVTIRKDLTLLENSKKLYRSHGKAILIDSYAYNKHINDKEKAMATEKIAIGRAAAATLCQGDSIIIGSGTTTLYFAKEIDPPQSLTVLTSSIPAASILSQKDIDEVMVLGGIMRKSSISTIGPIAEGIIRGFACSKLILGVDGIDLDFGLTTTNTLEASLNKEMISAAREVIVLADSSKFGRKGFSKICDIEIVNHIITDNKISSIHEQKIREMGITLTIVDTND